MRKALLAAVVIGLLAPSGAALAQQRGCGIPPIPPIPPVGCKAMKPVCVCDRTGQNCVWQFECVPR